MNAVIYETGLQCCHPSLLLPVSTAQHLALVKRQTKNEPGILYEYRKTQTTHGVQNF